MVRSAVKFHSFITGLLRRHVFMLALVSYDDLRLTCSLCWEAAFSSRTTENSPWKASFGCDYSALKILAVYTWVKTNTLLRISQDNPSSCLMLRLVLRRKKTDYQQAVKYPPRNAGKVRSSSNRQIENFTVTLLCGMYHTSMQLSETIEKIFKHIDR